MAMNRDSQQHASDRSELEAMKERQRRMKQREIRKRKLHNRKVKAAKKALKEFLVKTGAVIAMSASLFYIFFAGEPYEAPEPEPRMQQVIAGDYYYSEEDYEEYLKERNTYLEKERQEELKYMITDEEENY